MERESIMIFGLGDLGGYVLEFLSRIPNIPKIVTADINEDWGIRKTNSAIAGASQFNLFPRVEFIKIDAFDVDATAAALRKYRPSVIYNSMTLQSWWVITKLPRDAYQTIDEARFGPWFPMHFMPAYSLMQAVKKSGITCFVVNAAFPDLVNFVLSKIGLAPEVGIGNIDNIVCSVKMAVANKFQAPLRSVSVYMVAPHFVSYYIGRFGTSGGAPYYLKVMLDDRDVTSKIDQDDLLHEAATTARRPGGLQAHPVVASSVCRIIFNILFDTNEIGHAPGPKGLPGGYPVKLSKSGAEVFLPEGLTLEEAVRLNTQAQVYDGVERVEDDGTVIISERSASIFKELIGFDCRRYSIAECEAKAKELDQKFKKWATQL
jgi:hypothetical protein